jgi:tetratricopeptide (TPR) repeat protein
MLADKDLQNLLLRAEALMKTNWIHAVQLLTRAVEENPRDARPLIALGDFYQKRQLYQKAVKSYQSALKITPDDNHLKLIIGNTLFAEGEYQQAIVYYDQISNPMGDVRYNKALALAYMGRNRDSIAIMRDLLDMIDNNPFIYFLLIEQLLRIEDYDEARKYIEKAESKIGNHRHLQLLKALTFAHYQNWLFAYNAFFNYGRSGDIVQSEHVLIYADCAVKCGMVQRAIQILEKGLHRDPYAIGMYEELVRLLIQRRQNVKAREYLHQARRYFPLLTPLLQLMQSRLGRPQD